MERLREVRSLRSTTDSRGTKITLEESTGSKLYAPLAVVSYGQLPVEAKTTDLTRLTLYNIYFHNIQKPVVHYE